jgi:hypothetical protein
MHIADVRDAAAVLAAVMQPGRGPRRYLVTGHYLTMPGLIGTLGDLTGRRIRFVTLPAGFLAAFGRTADLAQRRLRTRLPWSGESIWIVNCDARCDDSKTRDELQVEPRALRETFADTVHWLAETGHLTPRQAGRLSREGETAPADPVPRATTQRPEPRPPMRDDYMKQGARSCHDPPHRGSNLPPDEGKFGPR